MLTENQGGIVERVLNSVFTNIIEFPLLYISVGYLSKNTLLVTLFIYETTGLDKVKD